VTAPLPEIVSWLDGLLRIDAIEDYPGAHNGLQVEAEGPVARIGAATDACQATIDRAVEEGCQLLLVHHGLFWGGGAPLTGARYRRVAALVAGGTALYSAHLPLDVHEEVGNNALLAAALDLEVVGRFGSRGSLEGLGVLARPALDRDALFDRVETACGEIISVIPGGPDHVGTLAIVTGGAGSMIGQAVKAGADALLTGEGSHHTYHEAMEAGITVIYAGHYATETFGVRALGERTAAQFGLESRFFDVPTGL